jgi:hypothetical protein
VLETMVELVGIEPTTSSLRMMSSSNLPQHPCGFPSQSRSKTVRGGLFRFAGRVASTVFPARLTVADARQRAHTVGRIRNKCDSLTGLSLFRAQNIQLSDEIVAFFAATIHDYCTPEPGRAMSLMARLEQLAVTALNHWHG